MLCIVVLHPFEDRRTRTTCSGQDCGYTVDLRRTIVTFFCLALNFYSVDLLAFEMLLRSSILRNTFTENTFTGLGGVSKDQLVCDFA